MKPNVRGRGRGGSRGRGAGRSAGRGGRDKRTGRDFESNDQSRRNKSQRDPTESRTLQYSDVDQVFDGFKGQTVFNQKDKLEKKEHHDLGKRGAVRSRPSIKGSIGRGKGNSPLKRDKRQGDPVVPPARTGTFHVSENKTEVYDFSKFSETDFARKPDFKRGGSSTAARGGRGRSRGGRGRSRGGRECNAGAAELPKRKRSLKNENESPPKRSRPAE